MIPHALAVCGLVMMSQAASPGPARLRLELDTVRTRVWFEADATLGAFTGKAGRVRGYAEVADTASLSGAKGRIEVDVASFRTGIGMRDGHLRGDLQASKHPTIVFALEEVAGSSEDAMAGIERPANEPSSRPMLLKGTLTVRGVTRPVGIPTRIRFTPDSVYAHGRVPVRFTGFEMKPPSRMLGMTRVDDELVLRFDAVFAVTR